jgi:SAM-dependent methyltransferase
MSIKDKFLESSIGYRLWSSSFIAPKVEAIWSLLASSSKSGGSFLDVGCGPGSNSRFFGSAFDYCGIDINPDYVAAAQQTYPKMRFVVGDAAALEIKDETFDVILINSLIHHLNDKEASALLDSLHHVLAPGGVIIVQEPLIPGPSKWFMRWIMNRDRGHYFRSAEHWISLYVGRGYTVATETDYTISFLGIPCWHMQSVLLQPQKKSC